MQNKIINLDVDGVLYPSLPIREYSEYGCFTKYAPLEGAYEFVQRVKELAKRYGYVIRFLTKTCSVSQHLHSAHEIEKICWLTAHMRANESEIYVLRSNENKSDWSSGILIDDYGKNCEEWQKINVNIAIQFNEDKSKEYLTGNTYEDILMILMNIIGE